MPRVFAEHYRQNPCTRPIHGASPPFQSAVGDGQDEIRPSRRAAGPSLGSGAAEILARIAKHGFEEERHAEQLWYGIGLVKYDWSDSFMAAFMEATLAAIPSWTEVKALTQVCLSLVSHKSQLNFRKEQKARLAELLTARVLARAEEEPAEVSRAVPYVIYIFKELSLPLEPHVLKSACDLMLGMPMGIAQEKGRVPLAEAFLWCLKMGHQPTGVQAALWFGRLEELEGEWQPREFSAMVYALALCRSYVPPPELKQRLRTALQSVGRNSAAADGGLRIAARAWGVET